MPKLCYNAFMEKLKLKRLWLAVPGLGGAGAYLAGSDSPSVTDAVFSRGIYPWLSSIWGFLPSLAPWSVAQWVVVAFLAFCVGFVVFYVVALVRHRGSDCWCFGVRWPRRWATVSIGFTIFALMCGLNYYRLTFAEDAGFELRESTTEELVTLCENLAAETNAARADIDGSPDDYAAAQGGFEAYAQAAVENMRALAETYPALSRPVYSLPSPCCSRN